MSDFQAARTNMVDCQIHTAGVISAGILQAFETVPRECFLPASMRNIAYADEDISMGDGRFLLEPMVHARMLQAIDPKPDDVVLDISVSGGYSAAILSSMVSTVVSVDDQKKYVNNAEKLLQDLDICNVAGFKGELNKGSPEHGPFDLIFMNGAVSEIPQHLISQLTPEGRMITIVRPAGAAIGVVTLVQNLKNGNFSSTPLFEAGCPYLPGFEPEPVFNF